MSRIKRVTRALAWAILGLPLLALLLFVCAMGLLLLSLRDETTLDPSWADVHDGLADWPVRVAEIGRPLSLHLGRGLKDNSIELAIVFRDEGEVQRWLRSLSHRMPPPDRHCQWQGDETSAVDVAFTKMPSCTDGAEWPWLLTSSEVPSPHGVVLRLRAIQPYD